MKIGRIAMFAAVWSCVLAGASQGALASGGKGASGTLTLDGKTVTLEYAYVDETDADEPILVLSDKPLPPTAIPFLSEKLVKEKGVHAVAFSLSRKDKTLTNTYGKVHGPGHELGVGLGRIEDGRLRLTIKRFDAALIEGSIATIKPVVLSSVSYAFDLTFQAIPGKK